jgi:superfamily I DNA/RNA helicase
MKFKELPLYLKIYLSWRLLDLKKTIRNNLIHIIDNSESIDYIISVLNIIGGYNSKKFFYFAKNNPDFNFNNPSEFDVIPDLNVALNPEQTEAVLHNTLVKPLLILAGAGSGKTAVLTRKVVFLLISGVSVDNIMAVTFSKKAAEEMKKRVFELISELKRYIIENEFELFINRLLEKLPEMKIGTFHSICFELLNEKIGENYNYEILGFDLKPEIIEPVKQNGIIANICKKNMFEVEIDDLISDISTCKSQMIFPENILDFKFNFNNDIKIVQQVYFEYSKFLIKKNWIDFDDILKFVVKLLTESKEIYEYYSEKYKYFLIDEYQDTNFSQYLFALKIVEKNKSIFAVGDDDQSIYGWRGADITNILNFKKDFSNALIIKFEKNYRSSGRILEAANNIFMDKEAEFRKILKVSGTHSISKFGYGEKIVLFEAQDEYEELDFCKKIILESVNRQKQKFGNSITKKYFEIKKILMEKVEELINSYNKVSEYTPSLWNKTVEWINFFYKCGDEISYDLVNQLYQKYFEWYLYYFYKNDLYEIEKNILDVFFEETKYLLKQFFGKFCLYKNYAIFFRINSQKNFFKTEFEKSGIPVIDIGNTKLYEFREIHNIISMFILIDEYFFMNSENFNSLNFGRFNRNFFTVCEYPDFKITSKDKNIIEFLPDKMLVGSDNFYLEYENVISSRCVYLIDKIYKFCQNIYKNYTLEKISVLYQKIIEFFEYNLKIYKNSHNAKVLKKNLMLFKKVIYEFEYENKKKENIISKFCKFVLFKSTDKQSSEQYYDGVYLLTLHSSKGLEFENVFFTGLEEEICPYKYPKQKIDFTENQISEEKRLFYVGITRAKENLYLSYSKQRKWFGKLVYHKKSRFLKLIPNDLIE